MTAIHHQPFCYSRGNGPVRIVCDAFFCLTRLASCKSALTRWTKYTHNHVAKVADELVEKISSCRVSSLLRIVAACQSMQCYLSSARGILAAPHLTLVVLQLALLPGVTSGQTVGGQASDGGMMMSSRGVKPGAQKAEAAQAALHEAFAKRGCDTLLRLGKKFHTMDDDANKGLTYEEVRVWLHDEAFVVAELWLP
jgi:hypothetical protein